MGLLRPALVEHLFFPSDWKLLKGQGLCLPVSAFGRGASKGRMFNKYLVGD